MSLWMDTFIIMKESKTPRLTIVLANIQMLNFAEAPARASREVAAGRGGTFQIQSNLRGSG